ncbi:MAG TPA: hypothetical protein VKD67_05515 [Acidimicrobiales bacterium]|nr:hypothetical protein [Acidimicrobiales bacterium]
MHERGRLPARPDEGCRPYGWVPVIVGGVCLLALMLVPEVHARRTVLH